MSGVIDESGQPRAKSTRGKFQDLSGRKFSRLLVLGPRIHKGKKLCWLCRCDCGEEKWIGGQALRQGFAKSCGCLKRQLLSERTLKRISGQRFGRLLVLDQHKIRGTSGIWLCRCDCGKEVWVRTHALKSGDTKSCGCLAKENRRKSILEKIKRYRVLLSLEQRRNIEANVSVNSHSTKDALKNRILLLTDQSPGAPAMTDKEIANVFGVGKGSIYYARRIFVDPQHKDRVNESNQRRLLDPRVKRLRFESRKRFEAKPEGKERARLYRLNLPPEVKARKKERAKIYSQTPAGKKKRQEERAKMREFFRTPEGKLMKRQYHLRSKGRTTARYNERYRDDPQFRIAVCLRKRLNLALKAQRSRKVTRTFELIGCRLAELVTHLEKRFKTGMTWENYGEWHIDHIIPCAKFKLTDPEQQRRCFNFSNLQPLWATENIVKSNKLLATLDEQNQPV